MVTKQETKKPKILTLGTGFGGRIEGGLEFAALRMDWEAYIGLLIRHAAPGPIGCRPISIATNIAFQRVPEDWEGQTYETDPTIKLKFNEAQQLMDELWKAGCRPSEVGTGEKLQALQNHLDDMRAIVSHTLDVPLRGDKR